MTDEASSNAGGENHPAPTFDDVVKLSEQRGLVVQTLSFVAVDDASPGGPPAAVPAESLSPTTPTIDSSGAGDTPSE